jgi:hypothetical protein
LQQLLAVGCKTNGVHTPSIREASGSPQLSAVLARPLDADRACECSRTSRDNVKCASREFERQAANSPENESVLSPADSAGPLHAKAARSMLMHSRKARRGGPGNAEKPLHN